MKKELIIIKYKFNVSNLSISKSNEIISNFIKKYSLINDEDLKKDYIIKEFYIPVECDSDVEIIYPINKSYNFNKLIDEITDAIKNDPTETLNKKWTKLVRELKIMQLGE